VVLPEPLGPMMATRAPDSTSNGGTCTNGTAAAPPWAG
jgi:hypothetical protein